MFADPLNVAIDLAPDAELALAPSHPQRALYVLEGEAQLDGVPLDAPRHLWWNFVSSSKERIEQAKLDWLEGRFGQVAGDDEFIPLPER